MAKKEAAKKRAAGVKTRAAATQPAPAAAAAAAPVVPVDVLVLRFTFSQGLLEVRATADEPGNPEFTADLRRAKAVQFVQTIASSIGDAAVNKTALPLKVDRADGTVLADQS